MKKLLLLFCALLCLGGSRAWATDVIISDQSNLSTINSSNYSTTAAHKYGTYSAPAGGTTFTTNSTSGLSGVTITSTSNIVKSFYYSGDTYKYGLAFKPTDGETYTITISAPENYVIIGYTMKAISTSQNQKFEVIASSGTYEVTSSQNYITGRVANQQSTTFTLRNKLSDGKAAAQELCLPFFTITLLPSNDASVTKISDVSDLSKSKTYLIHSIDFSPSDLSRGYLSGTSGYLASTAKTGNWSPNSFAIIQYDGKYFLYDVFNKKFVRTENYSSNAGEVKGIETNTSILPVTIEKRSDGIFKIKMGVNYMNFSNSYTYGITINYYSDNDAGNNLELIENGSFDDTEAIATLETYLANPSIVNGGKYKIKLNGTSFYISKDASGNAKTETTASELILSENGTNAAGKKAYSIKDAGTNKYLSYTDITYSGGENSRLSWADTDTNSKFVLTQGTGTYSTNILIRPADACDNNYVTSWNQNYPDKIFVFWTLSNTMSYWTLEKITKNVTYNLKWNGETIKTNSSVSVHIGGSAADFIPWDVPYSSFTCDVSTIGDATTVVNVTMDWDGPFEFSTDFASAKWYYLKLNNKYVYYDTESTHLLFSNDRVEEPKALWAFFGNPCGVKVANLYVGDGKFISNDDPAIMHASSFVENKIGSNAYGFYLRDKDYNCFIGDNGSGYVLMVAAEGQEASSNVTMKVEVSYKYLALSFIDEYTKGKIGGYFEPTQTAVDALKSLYAGSSEITSSDYNNLKSFINAQLAVQTGGFVYPTTGYYRIKSSGQRSIGESYIGYGSSDYGTGLRTVAAANKLSDASTVIKLTGSAGTYKLSTEGLNVQSQTAANAAFPATDADGVDFDFSVSTPGIVTIRNVASASGDRQGYLHEAQDGTEVKGVINWNPGAEQSKWTVENATTVDVSLTAIGDYTYATLGLPFGVTLPADVKAYILTVSGEWAIPTEISEVPAGTGVLLRGTSSSVTSATLTINDAASATTDGNKLVPTYVDITGARSDGEYILGNDATDGLGFYQRKSGKKIGANKAYLKLDADLAASVKGLLLNFDEETGISTVQGSGLMVNGSEIFNLAGQRMSRVQKGVNIVNGKKVLVK